MSTLTLNLASTHARALWQLCKPRVLLLILFCAVIGMALASPGWPDPAVVVPATVGIALVAAAAAMVNCLVERTIDARMRRTAHRATARGAVSSPETLLAASMLGAAGMLVLLVWVNALTAWLTLATFVGYAVVYTLLLKPATPQNIVIGGASGAMPPVLGWVAVTQHIDPMALALFLIIYAWTPPHFWALALYRRDDYARAGLPMLPVTHGERFTTLSILLYALLLAGLTLLPVAWGGSGFLYLFCVVILNLRLILIAVSLHRQYAADQARRLFAWSIWYLTALFAALLLDHYWQMVVR
ncbi:MAG: protoheme IX farnesyltransferase [Paludibacterium sp.]|uniref:heme o synthase n=1 Tax=Paludibacterium sp. TaxID=1917523 RepID=UPI0025EC18D5|nr:heme o synthase [Paludibacterium sp.]MBV8045799.1 protoheme IX farnesyltransferase [Paludibacterium sp.]MBV8647070.1 protoheme IX farnesyltransferase [Paludibacterium sp.]